MTVYATVSIPADQFALGRLFEEYPDVEIEVERIAPLHASVLPLFWVGGAGKDEIGAALRDDSMVEEVRHLTKTGGRHLFEIRWNSAVNSVVQPLIESNAEILRAEGTVDEWEFRLQFRSRDDLATFRTECVENDVDVEFHSLSNPSLPDESGSLTDEQQDILEVAYENGYWDVPRAVTLAELADRLDISSNAASQRLRRATKTLVGEDLSGDS